MSGADLLDFSLDGEAEEDYDLKASYSSSSSFTTAAAAASFCDETLSGSFLVSSIHRISVPIYGTEAVRLLLS